MKVWMYYARPSEVFPVANDVRDVVDMYGDDVCILYAFTNFKQDAKLFRGMRNMDIFKEVVVDLTEKEWDVLIGENRDSFLEHHMLRTRILPKDKSYPAELKRVSMLLTFMEYADINDNADIDTVIINGFSHTSSPIGVLKIPLLKELFKLCYWDILKIILESELEVSDELCRFTTLDEQLIEMLHNYSHAMAIDELEYFIQNYGHTLHF